MKHNARRLARTLLAAAPHLPAPLRRAVKEGAYRLALLAEGPVQPEAPRGGDIRVMDSEAAQGVLDRDERRRAYFRREGGQDAENGEL